MLDDYRDYLCEPPPRKPRAGRRVLTAMLLSVGFWAAVWAYAFADDTRICGEACHVQIQPTTIPGAVAVVVFLNADVHQPEDEGTFALTLGDLTVSVTVDADRTAMMRPDTMTVTPPAGFLAVPESVTVDEGGAGQIVIYEEIVS